MPKILFFVELTCFNKWIKMWQKIGIFCHELHQFTPIRTIMLICVISGLKQQIPSRAFIQNYIAHFVSRRSRWPIGSQGRKALMIINMVLFLCELCVSG